MFSQIIILDPNRRAERSFKGSESFPFNYIPFSIKTVLKPRDNIGRGVYKRAPQVASTNDLISQPQSTDINSIMATASTSDTPPNQYFNAVKYLVRKVTEETKAEGDGVAGVRWPKVRQWFLDRFADKDRLNDEDYLAEQKILAAYTVQRMSKVCNLCGPSIGARILTCPGTCFEGRKA